MEFLHEADLISRLFDSVCDEFLPKIVISFIRRTILYSNHGNLALKHCTPESLDQATLIVSPFKHIK